MIFTPPPQTIYSIINGSGNNKAFLLLILEPLIIVDSSKEISAASSSKKNKKKREEIARAAAAAESLAKRRTRSEREFDLEHFQHYGDDVAHIPVMLGEILEVFGRGRPPLRSFVDCTVGAAGHSSAIIQAHSELKLYIGLDIDPVAHEKAQSQIYAVLHDDLYSKASDLKAYTLLKNFKDITSVLDEVDEKLLSHGVDGILMDLGMSSMQVCFPKIFAGQYQTCGFMTYMALYFYMFLVNNVERGFSVLGDGPLDMRMNPLASLKAEDILNSWPEAEVGRILREYGEESNWRCLQNKIVKARSGGGLHSTRELVDLVQKTTPRSRGRQGWIKTATRMFQALRIAVNDELKTLEDSLYACFDCLSSGGRLAVISFHSLEDRIVKQTFLDIINRGGGDRDEDEDDERWRDLRKDDDSGEEPWVKNRIEGRNGTILTKRPITPSEEEERLNRRCRSAKLRVVQKV
ncbi:hypothetical protein HHK36_025882 [Tetracentron sinense]|uniref:Ribosomal RNA small subunit methyltransferase H n=1 Tax=Tetracentron sinense TaxID=13715 RepID=A0A834YHQ7_TETSI|nr:hypothetical protein HHK36_025882 [Tetracentron sinense]